MVSWMQVEPQRRVGQEGTTIRKKKKILRPLTPYCTQEIYRAAAKVRQ